MRHIPKLIGRILQALDLLGQLGLLGLFFSQYFMDVSQADDPLYPL
jgi:hypothetical protein